MKTLFIHKSNDLQLTARVEDSTDMLSIQGNWKGQDFGFSTCAKVEQQSTPFEKLLDLAEKAQTQAQTIVCAELSDYDKDLIELQEQCRKGIEPVYTFAQSGMTGSELLEDFISRLAKKHKKTTKQVIANLFAC